MEGKWVKLEQKGSVPGARSSHAVAAVGKKAYVFGGELTPRIPLDNKLHIFDLHQRVWSNPNVAGDIPPPRVGVTMTAIGDIIYVFGGRDADHNELNELFSFDTRTNEWSLLSSSSPETSRPPHRSYHSMAADHRRIYIFGGCGNAGRLNDLWAYDTADREWIQFPSPGEKCRPRGGLGLAVSGGKVWVLYGFAGSELDDVHAFDLARNEWVAVEIAGDEKPSPRSVFSTVGIGKYVFIYGGEIDPSDLGHLGAGKFDGEVYGLDTERCVWIRVSESGGGERPGRRGWCAFSAAEIDGEKGLFVYGGNSDTNDRLDDIFFFVPCL